MSEVEEKAKAQGWNPDYKGENAKSAEQFIEDGLKIAPIAAERVNKLTDDVAALTQSNKTLTDNISEFINGQHKVTAEAEKRGYDKAVGEIADKKRAAVAEGDTDTYDALDKEEKKLKKPEAAPTPKEKPKPNPEFDSWVKDNMWYANDSDLQAAADTYAEVLVKRKPALVGTPGFFKDVEKHIKLIFPDSFKASTPKLDTSENNGSRQEGKTGYSDLPPEAKKQCDRQCKLMKLDKKAWAASYFKGE